MKTSFGPVTPVAPSMSAEIYTRKLYLYLLVWDFKLKVIEDTCRSTKLIGNTSPFNWKWIGFYSQRLSHKVDGLSWLQNAFSLGMLQE